MKTSLIIHSHFYQPPRENPFTGIIPDQESAGSFSNWNEAVYKTCYRPNAYSRYLSSDGRIRNIRNNYSSISFNMGPSLLSWIKEEHPRFVKKLIEADKESLEKFGHSNIIAQAYSHTILPLDSPIIRKLDIQWAIADYKHTFKHNPEGFWCPECAVNLDVIDELSEAGIKFIILSPWQASKIGGKPLNGKPAPCNRPFIVKGKKKSLSVFFYDPDFASGISFGHLLRDADALYKKLVTEKKKRSNPNLINWATDGEIYGHHEAFGDMALAALIEKINDGNDFELTNYASYLEKHPATEEAELWLGEDSKGSSWSCSHGVGRWERNCGCHTGGSDSWNQLWRTPMRKAFNNLETKVHEKVISELKELSNQNPVELLCKYGDVLCGSLSLKDYLTGLSCEEKDFQKIAILLDITKNTVNMYTSCGWFFNDLGGIEPIQDMNYALYVAQSLSKLTNKDEVTELLNNLAKAKSNIPEIGNGKTLMKKELSKTPAPVRAACFFILNRYFAIASDLKNKFGFFTLKDYSSDSISIIKNSTFEEFSFTFSINVNESNKFEISVRDKENSFIFTTAQISKRTLRIISDWIEKKIGNCIKPNTFTELLKSMNEYIQITNANTSAINESVFFANMGICIKALEPLLLDNPDINGIKQICAMVNTWGSPQIKDLLKQQFDNQMNFMANEISISGLTDFNATNIIVVLRTVREHGIMPDITLLQDIVFSFLKSKSKINVKPENIRELEEDLNFSLAFKK